MRKSTYLLIILLALAACSSIAYAPQTGGIRLDPHSSYYPLPIMLSSPATFNVTTVNDGMTAYDPHILLVMTNASFQGLTGDVVVEWDGGNVHFAAADFTMEELNSADVPDTGVDAPYNVATLQEHIGVTGTADEAIWWAFKPFLSNPITFDPTEFTITLPSTDTRMLVYVLGKSSETAELLDMRVPPTQPGLVIPEPSILLAIVGSFGALALYAVKRKKT